MKEVMPNEPRDGLHMIDWRGDEMTRRLAGRARNANSGSPLP